MRVPIVARCRPGLRYNNHGHHFTIRHQQWHNSTTKRWQSRVADVTRRKATEELGSSGRIENIRVKAEQSGNATAQTIPIAGTRWLAPFKVPFQHYTKLNQRRPYTTQLLSAVIIWMLGDLAAQYITSSPTTTDAVQPFDDEPEREPQTSTFRSQYDPQRTLRALIIGGIAAIPSYRYFLWLGRSLNFTGSFALNISLKVVFNQLTFTPVFACYFFSAQTLLTSAMTASFPSSPSLPSSLARPEEWRRRARELRDRLGETVPRSWVNSWKVWPAVTAVSFAVVPVDLRSLFAGVAAIGWQTYLGLVNARAARLERERTGQALA